MRALRVVKELRRLLAVLASAMKPFSVTLALILMIIYAFAICITDVVNDNRATKGLIVDFEGTEQYYGTLFRTMLTLYESVVSGLEWSVVLSPLSVDGTPWLVLVFLSYITLVALAMCNLVTGIFVDKAQMQAIEDAETRLTSQLEHLFTLTDTDNTGFVDVQKFSTSMSQPEMQDGFKCLDLGVDDATGIFELLDEDGSGMVDTTAFISGCMRLRGPAKALEMKLVMLICIQCHEALDRAEVKHETEFSLLRKKMLMSEEKMESIVDLITEQTQLTTAQTQLIAEQMEQARTIRDQQPPETGIMALRLAEAVEKMILHCDQFILPESIETMGPKGSEAGTKKGVKQPTCPKASPKAGPSSEPSSPASGSSFPKASEPANPKNLEGKPTSPKASEPLYPKNLEGKPPSRFRTPSPKVDQ